MYGDPKAIRRGEQLAHTWEAGDVAPRPLFDYSGPESPIALTRVTVLGRVLCTIGWGTGQLERLTLRAPFVADVLGRVNITAEPIDALGATASVQAVPVTSGRTEVVRQLVGPTVPTPLNVAASYFHALTASTLTVAGNAGIAVAAGARVPVFPDSILTAGLGALEFNI